ncbi:2-dehydro-3-deoxygalactonokinase [Rhizorhabdus argentea]|uniref:2-dehydro-3-deoxygalactonokinase n=1 Tax=Rhizorhabdus argentea TaxID=1387174 RepID=UPI0030EE2090
MPSGAEIIAVDWGTTNRRAYAVAGDGTVIDDVSDGLGILAVEPGGFSAAIADLRARLGSAPMLLAGMIGSNRGWVEAPYRSCPAGLDELAEGLKRIPHVDAAIVPGLSFADESSVDIMRGEEIQLLGAVAAGLVSPDASACHPGTHAKWVKLESGRIAAFRTVMTGEMFALLKKHSIIGGQLQAASAPGPSFTAGVRRSLERCELTADLFQIRARGLIGGLSNEEASAYASGLLIGADIRAGLSFVGKGGAVALIGDPVLTALYAAALRETGRASFEVDGEAAFLAGIKALVEVIR